MYSHCFLFLCRNLQAEPQQSYIFFFWIPEAEFTCVILQFIENFLNSINITYFYSTCLYIPASSRRLDSSLGMLCEMMEKHWQPSGNSPWCFKYSAISAAICSWQNAACNAQMVIKILNYDKLCNTFVIKHHSFRLSSSFLVLTSDKSQFLM